MIWSGPGGVFSLSWATGALLTPKRSPGTEKVIRNRKNQFLCPGDVSVPTGQEFEVVFHRVYAWVRQGTRGSELSSKKFKSWIVATFFGILPRNVIFRVPGVAFRKTQGNPMPFEGFLWGEFTKKSCFHQKLWNCNDFIKNLDFQ